MDNLPKGVSGERNNGPINAPGIYRLASAKKEIITSAGSEGAVQADALVRVGFVRVGDVPTREELLNMQKEQATADALDAGEAPKDKKSDK